MESSEKIIKQKNKRVEKVRKPANPAMIGLIVSVILVGATGTGILISQFSKNISSQSTIKNATEDGNSASFSTADESSIENIAEKLSASVVSIIGTAESRSSFFYGYGSQSATAGTGVIVTSDGYIITNKHVVADTTDIRVILADGTTYENAKVVATDPLNDIAYLKIKGVSDLPAAELGDSKTLNIGQEVIAIGNALGQYEGTVTSGIISGVNRTVTAASSSNSAEVETLSDMIQTDAAINSGNSGGPLVNAKGQVIGINTAVASDAQGIGFAIPISATKGMLKSLIEDGAADRASLGVNYTQITAAVAKENNLPVKTGAWIYSKSGSSVIKSGSAAEKAGLKKGDIITAVNGVKIGSAGSVSSLIGEYRAGDSVKLTVIRDGKEIELTAILDAYSS